MPGASGKGTIEVVITITRHGYLATASDQARKRFWKDHRDQHGDLGVRIQGQHWSDRT